MSPRWAGRILALGLAALLVPGQPEAAGPSPVVERRSPAGVIDADDRKPLDTEAWPWIAIGRVNVAGRRFCTGTLIGPRHVLTAAHCLIHPRAKRVLPHTIHFVAGYRRGAYLAHSVAERVVCGAGEACDRERIDPADRWAPKDDWAIIVLRDEVGIKPLPLTALADEGLTVTRAGYGRDRAHLLSRHADCTLVPGSAGEPLMKHDCDATQGDSGSPLLTGTEGQPAVAAIHIGHYGARKTDFGVAIGRSAFAPALAALLAQ